MKLALRIDVDTLRATREGVPRLVELLRRHEAGATFLFATGPDRSGLMNRLLPGLPAPDIGRRCADVMRATRDAGFEVGLLAWDAARWRERIAKAEAEWTAQQMSLALARFEEIFGERPSVMGAPAWRMNKHAFRHEQALAFDYASDTLGRHPFTPVVRAEIVACPQVPTTLPTLDEVPGQHEAPQTHATRLLEHSAELRNHVFSLSAASEGGKRAAVFEKLLEGWKTQGYQIVAMRELLREAAGSALPLHDVEILPGRTGLMTAQGSEFLGPVGGQIQPGS